MALARSSHVFFHAIATDYDGTIAADGQTPEAVVEALRHFKSTGRRLILVTGRELDDLKAVFPEHDIFDRIVAENGAVLYEPASQRERILASPPPLSFVEALRKKDVRPLSVGHVIVASWEPSETSVLETIKAQGLELQIIFNKGAVMVLPPGVNKASGLAAALEELELSPVNVVGVGDAENDHAFLSLCGCSAAVANALPKVKDTADRVLAAARGAGVAELVLDILKHDAQLLPRRFAVTPGSDTGGEAWMASGDGNLLIAGHSAVGKSTLAMALMEQMAAKGLQFAILDPEGDFEELENAVQVGHAGAAPSLDEIAALLCKPDTNLVINALAVPVQDRPAFFADFLAGFAALRLRSGRPHWLVVDEAHHVLPRERGGMAQAMPREFSGTIFITVHPDALSVPALESIGLVLALGREADDILSSFWRAADVKAEADTSVCDERSVLLWEKDKALRCLEPVIPSQVHKRHVRKYAQGELGPDKSFYFRGPRDALNRRAANLSSFLNIAEGVDDESWEFHLRRGDYSRWLQESVKDEELAGKIAEVEKGALDPQESRSAIKAEIEKRYTAPARAG
jgi:hydroxymethylpyrimidine pyrophosphatase-like HAD family hydrolase